MLVIDYTKNCVNWNSRGDYRVKYLIIHSTASKVQSALDWFSRKESQVSAHYIVDRDGVVYNIVKEVNNAWHCGNARMNRESIGIELEAVEGDKLNFNQDCAFTELVRQIIEKYNILPCNIKLHRHIKTSTRCPISFEDDEWVNYRRSHFE